MEIKRNKENPEIQGICKIGKVTNSRNEPIIEST